MKIAIISPGDLPIPSIKGGAIETLTTYLLDENEREGKHEFYVYTNYDERLKCLNTKYKNTKIIAVKDNRFISGLYLFYRRIVRLLTLRRCIVNTYFIKKVCKMLDKQYFDRIVVEGNYLQVLQLSDEQRAKTILHLHTDILSPTSVGAQDVLHTIKKIYVISEFLKNQVLKVNPIYSGKIEIFRNAIDVDAFSRDEFHIFRETFRERYSIKEDELLAIFCGRLDPGKGIKELIQAVLRVPNCKLLVVGASWFSNAEKNSYVKELESLSSQDQDRFIFTGYIPHNEVAQYYYAADVGVFPSLCNEAAGLVIIEAMACGLPVITTRKGGIPEYADERACRLIEADENIVLNLIKELETMMHDHEARRMMGIYAEQVSRKYNVHTYFQEFCKLIEE